METRYTREASLFLFLSYKYKTKNYIRMLRTKAKSRRTPSTEKENESESGSAFDLTGTKNIFSFVIQYSIATTIGARMDEGACSDCWDRRRDRSRACHPSASTTAGANGCTALADGRDRLREARWSSDCRAAVVVVVSRKEAGWTTRTMVAEEDGRTGGARVARVVDHRLEWKRDCYFMG